MGKDYVQMISQVKQTHGKIFMGVSSLKKKSKK